MVNLGHFEEQILLILLQEDGVAAVDLVKKFDDLMRKSVTLSAVHVVLKRMEKKGLVTSEFGIPTAERGGRRQRHFNASDKAREAVMHINTERQFLWKLIPDVK